MLFIIMEFKRASRPLRGSLSIHLTA